MDLVLERESETAPTFHLAKLENKLKVHAYIKKMQNSEPDRGLFLSVDQKNA